MHRFPQLTRTSRSRRISVVFLAFLVFPAVSFRVQAGVTVDTFGTGPNSFQMEFVTIGNPGNTADTTGNPNPAGSVGYEYRIGKHEVSRDMVTKANSLGSLGITLEQFTPYGVTPRANMPASGISWFEAAKFVNWLNTSTGGKSAYKFDAAGNFQLWQQGNVGYDPNNRFRNSQAKYFLPSADEWYKAAYYDPNAKAGDGGYWKFPTGTDYSSYPAPVPSGTDPGTAVYLQPRTPGPADITQAGGLSPYGTMAQGGNIAEWEETETDLVNDNVSALRGIRGGSWESGADRMFATFRSGTANSAGTTADPTAEYYNAGFRVASLDAPSVIPEASAMTVWGLTGLCGMWLFRRRCNAM